MTYNTIKAAEDLLRSDTRGNWALADAVLADVPEIGRGGNDSRARVIADALQAIADELATRGLTNPAGTPYTVSHLGHLRTVAMSWPENARHREAAMRTHEDAMGRGRGVLAALCAVARGESPTPPTVNDDPVDPAVWAGVCDMVKARADRGVLYPVAGNDVNRLLARQVNYPAATLPKSVTDMLGSLAAARRGVRGFAELLADDATVMPEDDRSRDALAHALGRLIETCQMLLDVVTANASDEALAKFLAEEADR